MLMKLWCRWFGHKWGKPSPLGFKFCRRCNLQREVVRRKKLELKVVDVKTGSA